MGHYITASSRRGKATLRISGMHRFATRIYDELNAAELNAKDSGTGGSKKIPLEQLGVALRNDVLTQEENQFVAKAIALSGHGGITINFA